LPDNSKKFLQRRGVLEAVILAFVVGFGAVQYPADGALPSPISNQRTAKSTAPGTESHTGAPAIPFAVTLASAPGVPGFNVVAVDSEEFAAGTALAQLVASSGAAGRPAPSLSLPNLDGTEVSLDAMRGKVVLLNFWATWCGACRSEMPSLECLYRDFSSYSDFALLTVSTGERGKRSVEQFVAENSYDFPVLLDTENTASSAYGVSGLPSTFVIDRDGRIVWSHAGALDWSNSSLRDPLKKLLENKPPRSTGTIEARFER